MYSFYEIKEMEKAKAETIRKTSAGYSKKKQNSTPSPESVQERTGIIHYPDHPIITKTIRRFVLLTKVFFEKLIDPRNKALFSGGRS